ASAYLLATPGGTVDLREGTIHPADPEMLMTRETAVAPLTDQEGKLDPACPRFDSFMEKVFPDPDTRAWVLRYLGYSLFGHVGEHAALVLHGSGANGKSALLTIVRDILGAYNHVTPQGFLTA